MVLISRLAIDSIPTSGLSTACAIGDFAPDGSVTLVASALGLVFRDVQAGFTRCRGAQVVLASAPGRPLGTIERIQTLLGPTSVSGAAVLIRLADGIDSGDILKLVDLAAPEDGMPVRIKTSNQDRPGQIVTATSLFRPVSAALGGSNIRGFDVASSDGAGFAEHDSGSAVVDHNGVLIGMLVFAGGQVAHCVTASSLFF